MKNCYVCKEGFAVDEFDDDGFYTGKRMMVEEGEIWNEEAIYF